MKRSRFIPLPMDLGSPATRTILIWPNHWRSHFDRLRRSATFHLILILLVAAILRINQINQPFTDAFSWRQVSVAMMAENYHNTNWNILYPEVNWSGPGPNYQGREFQTVSYIAALLYTFTGQHDWVGRGIAVLFGLWGNFALYQLVQQIWDKERAMTATAVMAVLPASVIVERSFLPDPAMVALVVTGFWLWVAYLQTERSFYLLLAALVSAWGFCTKIPGLIVGLPMAYATFAILGYKTVLRPRKVITLGLFAVLTLVPVIAYYLWARYLALTYPPHHFAGDGNWLWQDGLDRWLGKQYFLPELVWLFKNWLWSVPTIGLVVCSLLMRPPKGKDNNIGKKAPWLFHWWFAAGVVYYFIGAQELVENPWNFHILSPAAAALAGHAILTIATFLKQRFRKPAPLLTKGIFLLLIAVFGYHGLQSAYYPYAEAGYNLGLALGEVTRSGDLVVTVGTDFGDPVPIYYSQRRGWGFPPPGHDYSWTQLPENDDEAIQQLEQLRINGARWLGIVNQHRLEIWQNHPGLATHIDHTCEVKQNNTDGFICLLLPPGQVVRQISPSITTAANDHLISHTIRYHRPNADRVMMVWGVNGWATVATATRPEGTIIIDELMYTPMVQFSDTFVATVQVQPGASIDYVFQITGTQANKTAEIWDTNNGQDYHTVAAGDGTTKVTPNSVSELTAEAPPGNRPFLLISLGLILSLGTVFVTSKIIDSNKSQVLLNTGQLAYLGDLLRELVMRDMKLRYKRSLLGLAWSLVNPLAQLLVFSFIFGLVLPLNIPNYSSFVFTGLLVWTWFQSSLFQTTGAIVDNRDLIRRPGFPMAVLPIVTVTTHLIHFLLALPILLIFLVLADSPLTPAVFLLPVLIALQFMFTLSLAYLVATWHVTFRDTQHLLGIALLLAFYLTPIFYDASFVPEKYRVFYNLNPMVHLVSAYRAILLHSELPAFQSLLVIGLVAILLLFAGYTLFVHTGYRFVEEL